MERKDFIKKFAIGGSILLTAPVLFNSCSKDEDTGDDNNGGDNPNEIIIDLTLADYADLGAVGGYAYNGKIIIFRTGDTSYMALSKECTHSQCTITYSHADGNLPCPCHGSKFNTNGGVINGPAASSLKKYNVTKEGNTLKIS
ncbi:Rieske (2Fe-2S) protein [Draconibacterium sp.]|nr:Rieske (2Fe-2S) protein [Draconibacterium sp.]